MKTIASRLTYAEVMVRAILVVAFALGTAAAAQVRIPLPGNLVPVTLQSAVVMLAGLTLGRRDGALSQVAYLLGGSVGLPFFAGFTGIIGPTGGYLIGFVAAAWITGSLRHYVRGSFLRAWAIAFVASLVIFLPGAIQLRAFLGLNWSQAFTMGVLPFIVGDVLKVTLVAAAHTLARRE